MANDAPTREDFERLMAVAEDAVTEVERLRKLYTVEHMHLEFLKKKIAVAHAEIFGKKA